MVIQLIWVDKGVNKDYFKIVLQIAFELFNKKCFIGTDSWVLIFGAAPLIKTLAYFYVWKGDDVAGGLHVPL